ncbi:MAG: acyl-CoA dehydrogenase family protein, partial [Streptosporangiaceae bacterium]
MIADTAAAAGPAQPPGPPAQPPGPTAQLPGPTAQAFAWTAEHEEFRAILRKLTESRAPLACAPGPRSQDQRERELWRTWTEEIGLPGLVIPEEHGGAGFSRLELAIAAEELGRAVVGGPLLASAVLATEALLALAGERADTAGADLAAEVLPGLAAGSTV